MATPDKTSETLDLAEAMNQDPSASESVDDQLGTGNDPPEKPRSLVSDENANKAQVDALTKLLNDTDMSFREKVVTKDSSSELVLSIDIENGEESIPSPFRQSFSPRTIETDADSGIPPSPDDKDDIIWMSVKSEMEKDIKEKSGKVFERVLEIQQCEPKKYTPKEFIKKCDKAEVKGEQSEVSKTVTCANCGRKIAEGAFARHLTFCTPKP